MIYLPNTEIDQRLVAHSRELVRNGLALLRHSDDVLRALRRPGGEISGHDPQAEDRPLRRDP